MMMLIIIVSKLVFTPSQPVYIQANVHSFSFSALHRMLPLGVEISDMMSSVSLVLLFLLFF